MYMGDILEEEDKDDADNNGRPHNNQSFGD
jgi:hypothetical protein